MSKAKQEEVAQASAEQLYKAERRWFLDETARRVFAGLMEPYGVEDPPEGKTIGNVYAGNAVMAYAAAQALWSERERRLEAEAGGDVVEFTEEEVAPE